MKKMINTKGKKTTIVAILGTIAILGVFAMWFFERITTSELQPVLTAIGLGATMIGLWFAKDATASHTTDKHVGPRPPKPPKK